MGAYLGRGSPRERAQLGGAHLTGGLTCEEETVMW